MPVQGNQPVQDDRNLSKKLLFRLSKAPYVRSLAREAIDAVLAAAAFEQDVRVLCMGDGVYQLLKDQNPTAIEQKNFTASFGLFTLYGINQVYALDTDLTERGLSPAQLLLPVTPLDREDRKSTRLNSSHVKISYA